MRFLISRSWTMSALPRKRSAVERLRETPCELTDAGRSLAMLVSEKQGRGRAYDELLLAWINGHRYFRLYERLLQGRSPFLM